MKTKYVCRGLISLYVNSYNWKRADLKNHLGRPKKKVDKIFEFFF